jgi:hypothetical protein
VLIGTSDTPDLIVVITCVTNIRPAIKVITTLITDLLVGKLAVRLNHLGFGFASVTPDCYIWIGISLALVKANDVVMNMAICLTA